MADATQNDDGILRYPNASDKFGVRPINPLHALAETPVHTYGSVALLATFGSDDLIVDAARTSYGKGNAIRDTRNLLRYLLRHQHSSPFEQAEVTFYLRLPIFVMRQLVRHRTANLNEYSARYSELSDDFYVPSASYIARQSKSNKQGRDGKMTDAEMAVVTNEMVTAQEDAVRAYRRLLDMGVARELARVPTTVGMYCYDDQTEVLTNSGFKLWSDVTDDDKLGIWDAQQNTLCYEFPEYRTRQQMDGVLYTVNHRSVSLAVTPHHKMWVQTRVDRPFELIPAEVLRNRSVVRYSKVAPYRSDDKCPDELADIDPEVRTAYCRFVGFFVGDGSTTGGNQVRFSLRKARKVKFLTKLCVDLDWQLERQSQHFVVTSHNLGNKFHAMCYAANGKQLPKWAQMLPQKYAAAILDGLRNSDGHTKTNSWKFVTTSQQVAEVAVQLGIHAGYPVNGPRLARSASATSLALWEVSFQGARHAYPVINQMTRNTSMRAYTGEVFCAKTRTGILVVRRKGRVVLSGNTECYWKCDVHNFMHMLKLRLDPHAQREIIDFAEAMYACARPYFPHTFEAFEDYVRNAYTMSALEIRMLADVLSRFRAELLAQQWPENGYGMSAREYNDFCRFLDTLVGE